jgi:hypothetical protein
MDKLKKYSVFAILAIQGGCSVIQLDNLGDWISNIFSNIMNSWGG